MKLAFLILSHVDPQQVHRLASRLVTLYDAPVVIHHDFNQSLANTSSYTGMPVRFVQPHVVTNWGGLSTVDAVLRGLELLRTWRDPDWFTLLSGSDYPTRQPDEVRAELGAGRCDAYLDHRLIRHASITEPTEGDSSPPFGLHNPSYPAKAYDRYVSVRWKVPWVTRSLHFTTKQVRIRHPWIAGRQSPFRRGVECYAGEFWFSGNRNAMGTLLKQTRLHSRLREYYRTRPNVDESFFHTILCNSDLRVMNDHRRYIDWPKPSKHPKTLDMSDFDRIIASGNWFARKFLPDHHVLDALDRHLGLPPWATERRPLPHTWNEHRMRWEDNPNLPRPVADHFNSGSPNDAGPSTPLFTGRKTAPPEV